MVLNHHTIFALESKGLRLYPHYFLLQWMILWLEEQGSMLRLSVALVCCQSKSNNESLDRKTAILHSLLPSQIWRKFPGINLWCFPGTRTFSLSDFLQIMQINNLPPKKVQCYFIMENVSKLSKTEDHYTYAKMRSKYLFCNTRLSWKWKTKNFKFFLFPLGYPYYNQDFVILYTQGIVNSHLRTMRNLSVISQNISK